MNNYPSCKCIGMNANIVSFNATLHVPINLLITNWNKIFRNFIRLL